MDQRFQTGLSTNADWPSLRDAQGCKCPKKQTPSHGSWGMMRIWHPTLCACSHAQSCMYNYTITTVPVSSVLYMTSFISCRPRRKKTNLGREIRVLPVLRPLCNDFKPWFYVPPCPLTWMTPSLVNRIHQMKPGLAPTRSMDIGQ